MEAVKKPQHFKQVMGITTALLICAHSKASGFTCYSNDKTWLHKMWKRNEHDKNNQTKSEHTICACQWRRNGGTKSTPVLWWM